MPFFSALLFSFKLYAIDFETKSIIVPKNIFMVRHDPDHQVSEGYQYQITFKKFDRPKVVLPQQFKKNDTIEKLLASLFHTYATQSKEQMLELFSLKAQKSLKKLSDQKFNQQFSIFENIKRPMLSYALVYQDGVIVSWIDESFINARKVFIKKHKGTYQIFPFHASKEDAFFWNVNMFLEGSPFLYYTPNVLKKFTDLKPGEKKKLSFELHQKNNYVHIFKQYNQPVSLSLKDNHNNKSSQFHDVNFEDKIVEMAFESKHFSAKGKTTLYYIESNFPLAYVPESKKKMVRTLTIHVLK